jgi:hypothetical protein
MFNTKFIDLNQIIDRIKRGNLYKEMSYETAIDYAVDVYRLLNNEKAEVPCPFFTKIENYRAKLPDNFERVIATGKTDSTLSYIINMRYATSSLTSVRHCTGSPDLHVNSDYTYSLSNNYINTSFEEGHLFMVYTGLMVNEDGVIMIPDEVNTIKAVTAYVKHQYLKDLASDDPVVNKHMDLEDQEYCWYIGKAQSAMNDLNYDQYRALANSMNKFFDNEDHYDNLFADLGVKQFLVNQRYG